MIDSLGGVDIVRKTIVHEPTGPALLGKNAIVLSYFFKKVYEFQKFFLIRHNPRPAESLPWFATGYNNCK
jgi:hypothetical protein